MYDPEADKIDSYLKFWGTRGSVSVSGAPHVAYGGDTCCLEIRSGRHLVVIDAGTGIRKLGHTLIEEGIDEIHLVIGHTHWDHIMGFPFFAPIHFSDADIHIYAHLPDGITLEQRLSGVLDPAYFPVGLGRLRARLHFHRLECNKPVEVGPIRLRCAPANHPGGAVGFLIEKEDHKIGYVTDNEVLEGYLGDPREIDAGDERLDLLRPLMELLRGCRPLVHEAQYTPRLYQKRVGWGHSSIANASLFAKLCEADHWIVTHHDPADTDRDIRAKREIHWKVLADLGHPCRTQMAYDEMLLPLL